MSKTISLLFGASNAFAKWLSVELPRLPVPEGKQAGVNTLTSDDTMMCWQAHIIDNQYKSRHRTIIVCEATSRFIFFIPVTHPFTLEELTKQLFMEWQSTLAETLKSYQYSSPKAPGSEVVQLLRDLSDLNFKSEWVKNTDLSINGHISDAGLWVEQILREQGLSQLSVEQAIELAIYLNTSPKRITNKQSKRKEKFIPVEKLLAYCRTLILDNHALKTKVRYDSNVISFEKYKNK